MLDPPAAGLPPVSRRVDRHKRTNSTSAKTNTPTRSRLRTTQTASINRSPPKNGM
ncbi:MAG: hypothetical protein LBC97_15965 [Bifidobacteriaceae bacterium]|nr:hypothetical protein [Bifidobacteriaceae bacterium]